MGNMVEKNRIILNMIEDGYSIQDIRKHLDIDYKELNIRLNQIKRCGYEFLKQYSNEGDLHYLINHEINPLIVDSDKTIINLKEHSSSFHFIANSDTHFGHINDSMNMIYNLYNYASNNNINSIVTTGDFIEGDFTNLKYVRNKTVASQLNYVIKNYPYDDKILNYILLGNHDQHSLTYDGLNIKEVLNSRRYDFNVLGYGLHTLKINNVSINLKHQLTGESLGPAPIADLTLMGHSHDSKMEIGECAQLVLPTCSLVAPGNDSLDKYNVGALDINVKLGGNAAKMIEIKELEVLPKVKVKNVIAYRIGQVKNNRRN